MYRLARHALAFVILALLAAHVPAVAQGPDSIEGTVDGTFQRIKIAIPDAKAGDGFGAVARELIETLRADLEFSGVYDVIDPALYWKVPPAGGQIPHDDWLSIDADEVTQIKLSNRSGRIDVVAELFENNSRTRTFGKRYAGTKELIRRVAHMLADELVLHATGRRGVATTRIAFTSKHGKGKELFLMDYDGYRIRRLTTTSTINLTPVWSPDGSRLAFVSWRGKQPGIYIMGDDGTLQSAAAIDGELNAAPDWSPDGQKIVYSSDTDGNSDLYILNLATGRNTRLTRTQAIETAPAYSPNGREIAFTSDRSGTPQVYLMGTDGLNVRRVSSTGSYNESPAWSPEGDKLAYVSRMDGQFEILVLDIPTGKLTKLTKGRGNKENPRWSPDGRHLVFAWNRTGTYDIYTMRDDGSDVRRLTRGGDCFTPDWSR